MSKKKNLSGKCLALTALWPTQFQYFGKFSFLSKNDFFIFFLLTKIFYKLLKLHTHYFITKSQYFIFTNQVILIFSTTFINIKSLLSFFRFLFLLWNLNINSQISLQVYFYLEKSQYFSSDFLKSYILYLMRNKVCSPKKIFNLLILMLKKNKFQPILTISKNGFKKNVVTGFKIQLKGRYESTKNEMASRLFITNGKTNSTTLNISINYLNHFFYTKLGTSNLKIWVFHSLKL
uniref:Ribosomal protein S3 n=1 Tax=Rhodomelopsis africana TaxID=1917047 RepID=UPI0022FD578D|nr:Ribosomal protein S3 [Rhodomelopsis africana]WAX04064.1 Ribosomal protein S3 [Rhodomelopsis africana]